jgi:ketosteroid isomerase-like protein
MLRASTGERGDGSMTKSVARQTVEAFYNAYADRDVVRVAEFLDDKVVWTINGPVDHLPYCGTLTGKAAVIHLIQTLVPKLFYIRSFVREVLVVDGDRAATLNKLTAPRRDDGHSISYRVAQFLRFRAVKLVEYYSIIDSYDAVEQVTGHRIGSMHRASIRQRIWLRSDAVRPAVKLAR